MPLIGLLISLIIYGLILAVFWWVIQQIPVPEPFSWVIRVVFALVVLLVLLGLLTGGMPLIPLRLAMIR